METSVQKQRKNRLERGGVIIEAALLLMLIVSIAVPSLSTLGKEYEKTVYCDLLDNGLRRHIEGNEGLPFETHEYISENCWVPNPPTESSIGTDSDGDSFPNG